MFEVEKKFNLRGDERDKLLEGAEFCGEKKISDAYFDTPEFTLTKNDMWLRKRGDEFELKLPVFRGEKSATNQYQEIEGAEKIREIFAIAPIVDFETDIKAFGYEMFCDCATTRKKYKRGKFNIDLDTVRYRSGNGTFEDFEYCLAEIEIMVDDPVQMGSAEKEIISFASSIGLRDENVYGKVVEYLKRKKPEHFKALVASGVVSELENANG